MSKWMGLICILVLILLPMKNVSAAQIDLGQVQDELDQSVGAGGFSIEDFVAEASQGKSVLESDNLLGQVKEAFVYQWDKQKGQMLQLLLLGLLSGIFTNFSATLGRKEMGEMGFFIVYLVLFGVVSASFYQAFAVAKEALTELLDFMKVLVPAFSLSLATVTGSVTSSAFYQMNLMGMAVADAILMKMVLPGTQIYFLLNMANYFMKDARFTKMAELVYMFLQWILKTSFGIIVGLQGIQMLLYPVIDQVKRNAMWKTASAIPGMGGLFGTVTETILGTGVIIKSAVGIGGLIGICLICMIPMMKLLAFTLVYRITSALLQPISDSRVVSSLEIASDSGKMLLSAVVSSTLLFLLSIAIVLQATNRIV